MGWTEIYRGRVTTAEEAVKAVASGDHVWLHAGCNNPEELARSFGVEWQPLPGAGE